MTAKNKHSCGLACVSLLVTDGPVCRKYHLPASCAISKHKTLSIKPQYDFKVLTFLRLSPWEMLSAVRKAETR